MSDEPMFRVIRGTPTPEELAALLGVLWSRRHAAPNGGTPVTVPSRWRASALPSFGRLPRPGAGAWRSGG